MRIQIDLPHSFYCCTVYESEGISQFIKSPTHGPLCAKTHQSCLILCNPVDCILPGSSVHGIPRARILEWVARPFSRKSAQPRDQTCVSCIAGRFFTTSAWETLCDFGGTHPSTHPISQLLLSVHPGLLRGVAG